MLTYNTGCTRAPHAQNTKQNDKKILVTEWFGKMNYTSSKQKKTNDIDRDDRKIIELQSTEDSRIDIIKILPS